MADIIDTIDALIAEQPAEERRVSLPVTLAEIPGLTVYSLHVALDSQGNE